MATESWLKSSVPESITAIDGFNQERRDREETTIGGGVCMHIREGIPYTRWKELENPELETLWVTLRPKRLPRQWSHISVGGIYMPPGCPERPRKENQMISHILHALDTISKKHPYTAFIVMGDFNKMKGSALKGYPLKQIVLTPTSRHNSILDCIYTNVSSYYNTPTVSPGLGLSDHGVVLCTPKAVRHQNQFTTIESRTSNMGAKSAFVEALTEVNWTPLYQIQFCIDQYHFFSSIITSLLDVHLPAKTTKIHATDKPWITQQFKDLISRRQEAKNTGNDLVFNFYRNKVNRTSKTLRSNYYQRQVEELKTSDPHSWWSKTKQIIGVDRKGGGAEFSNIANKQFNGDNAKMVDEMNIFLHSVSEHLTPLSPASKPPIETVPDEFIISIETVEKCLMDTKVRKAPGPDGIPNWVLADLAGLLSGPICAQYMEMCKCNTRPKSENTISDRIRCEANITNASPSKTPRVNHRQIDPKIHQGKARSKSIWWHERTFYHPCSH